MSFHFPNKFLRIDLRDWKTSEIVTASEISTAEKFKMPLLNVNV